MKRAVNVLMILVLVFVCSVPIVCAEQDVTKILLSDDGITVNGEKISNDINNSVYLSLNMNNGGTSEEAKNANLEVENIINIIEPGTYEISGSVSDGQIAIDANKIDGIVNIVLNNANITCKNAPAIFVYCKDINNEKCKVTISTERDSVNNIIGNRIKKVSVEGWSDQESIVYYIEKAYDEEGNYYERYKYDGAISSDISLTFEGRGTLNVTSTKKEGIETKMHFTMESGTLIINALDDAINAAEDRKSIITINGGTLVANVLDAAEEGDGIDSNGYIYINGGTVYAFAHPGSDNGIDSDLGTYINGGTVFAIGNMYEEAKTSNDTNIIQMQLKNKINEGDSIVMADENENALFAYKADREFSTVVYSSEKLNQGSYNVYSGTAIVGTLDEYNIYKDITDVDLSQMTLQEKSTNRFPNRDDMDKNMPFEEKDNTIAIALIIVGVIVAIGVLIVSVKLPDVGKGILIGNLIAGILAGSLITYGVINISKDEKKMDFRPQKPDETFEQRMR